MKVSLYRSGCFDTFIIAKGFFGVKPLFNYQSAQLVSDNTKQLSYLRGRHGKACFLSPCLGSCGRRSYAFLELSEKSEISERKD